MKSASSLSSRSEEDVLAKSTRKICDLLYYYYFTMHLSCFCWELNESMYSLVYFLYHILNDILMV